MKVTKLTVAIRYANGTTSLQKSEQARQAMLDRVTRYIETGRV